MPYYDPFEVFEDREHPGDWRCEAAGDDGEVLVVIFSGPHAEERARCYADANATDQWIAGRPPSTR